MIDPSILCFNRIAIMRATTISGLIQTTVAAGRSLLHTVASNIDKAVASPKKDGTRVVVSAQYGTRAPVRKCLKHREAESTEWNSLLFSVTPVTLCFKSYRLSFGTVPKSSETTADHRSGEYLRRADPKSLPFLHLQARQQIDWTAIIQNRKQFIN